MSQTPFKGVLTASQQIPGRAAKGSGIKTTAQGDRDAAQGDRDAAQGGPQACTEPSARSNGAGDRRIKHPHGDFLRS